MLDALTGAAGPAALIPGGQVLGVVAAGLELAKGLFAKGDMQGTQDMIKTLNELVTKLGVATGQVTEAMPFTKPGETDLTTQSYAYGTVNAQTLENKFFMSTSQRTIDITADNTAGTGGSQPINYGTLPEVDGSPAGDQRFTEMMSARVDGGSANKGRALAMGSEEWLAVGWAMQQNPNVRYNADTKEFTLKMSDGTERKLCTLDEAKGAVGAGGFNRGNPAKAAVLGDFLNQRAEQASNTPSLGDLVDEMKKLLKQLEDAQAMMRTQVTTTIDIAITAASK
jgi:hypothetical protein